MLHYRVTEGRLNDPNGPIFHKGKWHLFYQHNTKKRWAWGHAVSTDLLEWKELPDVFLPVSREDESEAGHTGAADCWSGAAATDGTRVAAVFYGHQGDCGLFVMEAEDDELTRWHNVTAGPAIRSLDMPNEGFHAEDDPASAPWGSVPYTVYPMLYDPFIWYEGGRWLVLSAGVERDPYTGGFRRQEYLFTSGDLIHWSYEHPLITSHAFSEVGDDGACPYFVPFDEAGRERLLLHYSHQYGPRYVMGRWDEKALTFTPWGGGRVNAESQQMTYHAPSCALDGEGNIIAWYVIHHQYGSVMSVPHRLYRSGERGEWLAAAPACDYRARAARAESFGADAPVPLAPESVYEFTLSGKSPAIVLEDASGVFLTLRLHRRYGGTRFRMKHLGGIYNNDVFSLVAGGEDEPPVPLTSEVPSTGDEVKVTLVLSEHTAEFFLPDGMPLCRPVGCDFATAAAHAAPGGSLSAERFTFE